MGEAAPRARELLRVRSVRVRPVRSNRELVTDPNRVPDGSTAPLERQLESLIRKGKSVVHCSLAQVAFRCISGDHFSDTFKFFLKLDKNLVQFYML